MIAKSDFMKNLILELFNADGTPCLVNLNMANTIDPGSPDKNDNPSIVVWFDNRGPVKCYGIDYETVKELLDNDFHAEFIV